MALAITAHSQEIGVGGIGAGVSSVKIEASTTSINRDNWSRGLKGQSVFGEEYRVIKGAMVHPRAW